MENTRASNFTEDYHFLVALISHLSATRHKNRTPREIAGSLAMDHREIERILIDYPSFFRQSKNVSPHTKEKLFTVHLRYALRRKEEVSNNYDEPLDTDSISLMLNLIAEMVRHEREEHRLNLDLEQKSKSSKIAVLVAIGTALISSFTALTIALISISNS